MPDAAAKICVICGLDAGKKPRTKDAQGRYTCKECLDAAARAKSAQDRARAPAGAETSAPAEKDDGSIPLAADNSFLLDLAKPKLKPGELPCPSCAKGMGEGAKVCVHCGFNTQTGQRLFVNVLQPRVEAGSASNARPGSGFASGMSPALAAGIAGVVLAALFALTFINPTFAIAYFGVSLLFSLAMGVTLVVAAFMDGPMQGILCLLCGPYAIYWALAKCGNDYIKFLWIAALLGGIGAIGLNALAGDVLKMQ